MRPRTYSSFWLGYCLGLLSLSPLWAEREQPEHVATPADDLDMHAWLRLSEGERASIVQQYANRRPKATRIAA